MSREFDSGIDIRGLAPLGGQARRGRARVGWWWSSTICAHVPYSNGSQRELLLQLDADPAVSWIVHEPLLLRRGSVSALIPFTVERGGTSTAVISAEFNAAEMVGDFAGPVGWDVLVLVPLSPVRQGNLRWLSGFRHSRFLDSELDSSGRAILCVPVPLAAAAEALGPCDRTLPFLFHKLWCGELHCDLDRPLDAESLVWSSP